MRSRRVRRAVWHQRSLAMVAALALAASPSALRADASFQDATPGTAAELPADLTLADLLEASQATEAADPAPSTSPADDCRRPLALDGTDGRIWDDVTRLYRTPGERHGGGFGHRGPFIPEPMVFDLVRSLGAAVGEAEINTLALFGRRRIDWAPEVEFVAWRNFAIEFEFPFQDEQLESYKVAFQHTLGTGWGEKFIHGWQGIVEHRRESDVTDLTLLHVGGMRFDKTWSTLWMLGGRAHVGGTTDRARSDFLANASVFADVTKKLVAGVETNLAVPLGTNRADLLIMPQLHIDLTHNLQLQCGFGPRIVGHHVTGEAGLRLIWSF